MESYVRGHMAERDLLFHDNVACPHSSIKVWSNQRQGNTHVCIWFDRINYLVVLKQLSRNYLLKTTYIPESRRRQQLHKEYAAWKKTGHGCEPCPHAPSAWSGCDK